PFWISDAGYIGNASVLDKAHDVAYIRTSSTVPKIWDGNLTAPIRIQVTGVARPARGMRVCTSGAVSGARCATAPFRAGGLPRVQALGVSATVPRCGSSRATV